MFDRPALHPGEAVTVMPTIGAALPTGTGQEDWSMANTRNHKNYFIPVVTASSPKGI